MPKPRRHATVLQTPSNSNKRVQAKLKEQIPDKGKLVKKGKVDVRRMG